MTIKSEAFDGGEDGHEAPCDDLEKLFASLAYPSDGAEPPAALPPRHHEELPLLERDDDESDDEPTLVRPDPLGAPPTAPVPAASGGEMSPLVKPKRPFSIPTLRPRRVRTLPPPRPARPPPPPPVPVLRAASHARLPPPQTFPQANVAPASTPATSMRMLRSPRILRPRARAVRVFAGATLAAGTWLIAYLLFGSRPQPQTELTHGPPAAPAVTPVGAPDPAPRPAARVSTSGPPPTGEPRSSPPARAFAAATAPRPLSLVLLREPRKVAPRVTKEPPEAPPTACIEVVPARQPTAANSSGRLFGIED